MRVLRPLEEQGRYRLPPEASSKSALPATAFGPWLIMGLQARPESLEYPAKVPIQPEFDSQTGLDECSVLDGQFEMRHQ